jgi:hypothetical protein
MKYKLKILTRSVKKIFSLPKTLKLSTIKNFSCDGNIPTHETVWR